MARHSSEGGSKVVTNVCCSCSGEGRLYDEGVCSPPLTMISAAKTKRFLLLPCVTKSVVTLFDIGQGHFYERSCDVYHQTMRFKKRLSLLAPASHAKPALLLLCCGCQKAGRIHPLLMKSPGSFYSSLCPMHDIYGKETCLLTALSLDDGGFANAPPQSAGGERLMENDNVVGVICFHYVVVARPSRLLLLLLVLRLPHLLKLWPCLPRPLLLCLVVGSS